MIFRETNSAILRLEFGQQNTLWSYDLHDLMIDCHYKAIGFPIVS